MSNVSPRRLRNAPPPVPRNERSKPRSFAAATLDNARDDELSKNQDSSVYSVDISEGAQAQIHLEQLLEYFPHDTDTNRRFNAKLHSIKMSSRLEHIRALALAYAFVVCAQSNVVYKNYIDGLRTARKRNNRKTTDFHLVVESFISYGSGLDGNKNKNALKLNSRDVQAIKYLMSKGIRPDRVEEYAKEAGQGLDAWARASNSSTSKKNQTAIVSKQTEDNDQETEDSTPSHHGEDESVRAEKIDIEKAQMEHGAVSGQQTLFVNWINVDGLANKLVIRPDQPDIYHHAQELIYELDMIYAMMENNLPDK